MSEALLGIDLGGTNCRGALVTPDGRAGEVRWMETRIEEGLDPFLDRLCAFCRELAAGGGELAPRTLGVGAPGVIAADGTVRVSPNLTPLDGVPLAARLEQRLKMPVTVVNDANAIAWGEALFGAGRRFPSFLALTLGTGVGGGLVLDRRLWEGADGAAGEIGHVAVEPQGRRCGCGSRGCLEQYASATGIVKTVRELLADGRRSLRSELPETELTSRRVAEAARQGDEVALAALADAGRRLGQVLAAVANLLNLDGVVVTGGASESLELMRPALEREVRARAFAVPAARLAVVRGELGEEAGILGAARLAWDRRQE